MKYLNTLINFAKYALIISSLILMTALIMTAFIIASATNPKLYSLLTSGYWDTNPTEGDSDG